MPPGGSLAIGPTVLAGSAGLAARAATGSVCNAGPGGFRAYHATPAALAASSSPIAEASGKPATGTAAADRTTAGWGELRPASDRSSRAPQRRQMRAPPGLAWPQPAQTTAGNCAAGSLTAAGSAVPQRWQKRALASWAAWHLGQTGSIDQASQTGAARYRAAVHEAGTGPAHNAGAGAIRKTSPRDPTMLQALLKTVHLLSIVLWIGGMFFTLVCLRPALGMLEPPQRLRLMHEVLRRFFDVVLIAAGLALATGVWMIAVNARAAGRAGVGLNMPLDWYAMAVLGMLMVAIFVHVRFTLYRRLARAVAGEAWPEGGAALASIARAVQLNLVLGFVIIVVTQAGSAL